MGKIRGDVLCSVLLKEQYSMKLQHIAATRMHVLLRLADLFYDSWVSWPEGLLGLLQVNKGAGRKPKEG